MLRSCQPLLAPSRPEPHPARWKTAPGQPQGPLTPLLGLLGLPDQVRDLLASPPPMNRQPDLGIAEVLLALNRSGLDDETLSKAKKTMRRLAQKQGTVT